MKRCFRASAVAAALFASSACVAGMNRNRLNIGAYGLADYAQTERHVREAKACGIDFFICIKAKKDGSEKNVLDLLEKYDIGAFVQGVTPAWYGGPTRIYRSIEKEFPFDRWIDAAKRYQHVNHPAVWGYCIADEPGALTFPYYRRIVAALQANHPDMLPFFNLLPNVAPKDKAKEPYETFSARLVKEHPDLTGKLPDAKPKSFEELFIFFQAKDYEDYIRQYCENVPLDYLSYDFYLYKGPERRIPLSFENMKTVADACRRSGRDFWSVMQVNSSEKNKSISVDGLRYQAYQSMAYGATTLMWACYTAGWWHNQVLDEKGEKTEQYEKLKAVNQEIRRFESEFMRHQNVATYLVGDYDNPHVYFRAPQTSLLPSERSGTQEVRPRYDGAYFMDVHASGGEALMIGEMVGRRDAADRALFICAADDPMEKSPHAYEIVFTVVPGRTLKAYGTTGELPVTGASDGTSRVPIRSNGAVLLVSSAKSAEPRTPWSEVRSVRNPQSWAAKDIPACEGVRSLWIEGEKWKGKPTRFFAYYGLPKNLKTGERCPGIVLVHGGDGTAYDWWVKMWNDRGYAAIAMDTCGAIPVKDSKTKGWSRHEWSGPAGWGNFSAANDAIKDQWTYHAVATVMRSMSFLRAQDEVDPDRIGLTGISWGGYLTCIVAGVDSRFRFAVPVYGCGYYGESPVWGKSLDRLGETGRRWLDLWDPSVYLPNARCPFLWVSGKHDPFYPYAALKKSSELTKGPVEFAIQEDMVHGHKAGSSPESIHAFADRILKARKK